MAQFDEAQDSLQEKESNEETHDDEDANVEKNDDKDDLRPPAPAAAAARPSPGKKDFLRFQS